MQARTKSMLKRGRWLAFAALLFLAAVFSDGPEPASAVDVSYPLLAPVAAGAGVENPAADVNASGVTNALLVVGLVGIALFPYRFAGPKAETTIGSSS